MAMMLQSFDWSGRSTITASRTTTSDGEKTEVIYWLRRVALGTELDKRKLTVTQGYSRTAIQVSDKECSPTTYVLCAQNECACDREPGKPNEDTE